MGGHRSTPVIATPEGLAMIIPPALVAVWKARAGGQIVLTQDDDGSWTVNAYNDEGDLTLAVARQIMRNDRVVLHTLANS